MDKSQIEKKVIEIIAEQLVLEPENILPDSRLINDLGMDSFGALEIVFAIEEEYSLEVEEDEIRALQTVNDVTELIASKTAS